MSSKDTCFGCKYFTYDNYEDDYNCFVDIWNPEYKFNRSWEVRNKAFRLYDRQKMSEECLTEICKENPCEAREEKEGSE